MRPDVAENLWKRIEPILRNNGANTHQITFEKHLLACGKWEAYGLNERLR